ncbi:MAG: hypothetical protein JW839_07720, partial [Candidatus Lokiarchaeota archaeon]|nr:hypothetical protein [Candidatus Lokiarchaeota archaeon]
MRFFLLFDTIPLTPAIPLKALTSQGRRLDVACRMLRACVLGPDGRPSGDSASGWFSGAGRGAPAVAVHVDGRALVAEAAIDFFRSELVLARHLKNMAGGGGDGGCSGITLQALDDDACVADAFLESIKREKKEGANRVVVLHE